MSPRPAAVVYHEARERRRAPAVLVGLLGLCVLVAAQVALAGGAPADRADRAGAVAVGPTVPVTVDPGAVATGGAAGGTAGPTAVPPAAALPSVQAGEGLVPVPATTVAFAVGAVLDEQAVADLQPVLDVLTRPGAAPVLLTGSAEPGADDASALRLAQQRADAVAAVLVESGAPASLLRTAAVVDPRAGRSVVVAAEVP